MIDSTKYQSQASELPQKLWAITKNLRGNMDSAKSRNYILGTIFYGRLSERTEDYMQEILKGDGLTHIQKTVDAYVKHIDEDKFAHVVDMTEIEANDWNLNIPHYVDTFEEEKPVNLEAVRADLKRIGVE